MSMFVSSSSCAARPCFVQYKKPWRQAQYSDAGAPSVEELYNGSGGRNSPPAAQPKPLDNSNPDGKTMTEMSSSVLSNLAPSRQPQHLSKIYSITVSRIRTRLVQNKKDFVMNTACEHYGMLPHCGQLVRQRTGLITTIRNHIVAGKVFGSQGDY